VEGDGGEVWISFLCMAIILFRLILVWMYEDWLDVTLYKVQ
jgi:hypothetical protein